jgi:hypothetical protein
MERTEKAALNVRDPIIVATVLFDLIRVVSRSLLGCGIFSRLGNQVRCNGLEWFQPPFMLEDFKLDAPGNSFS